MLQPNIADGSSRALPPCAPDSKGFRVSPHVLQAMLLHQFQAAVEVDVSQIVCRYVVAAQKAGPSSAVTTALQRHARLKVRNADPPARPLECEEEGGAEYRPAVSMSSRTKKFSRSSRKSRPRRSAAGETCRSGGIACAQHPLRHDREPAQLLRSRHGARIDPARSRRSR